MSPLAGNRKLHGFSKDERLCNFTLKKLVFEKGEVFNNSPLHFYWKLLNNNLEPYFFINDPSIYIGLTNRNNPETAGQNPSWPYKKIPSNALFHSPVKCLVGVSKKSHRDAVARNRLKRLIRESYRKNKQGLYAFLEQENKLCLLAIIYTGKPVLDYEEIERKIIVSLQKIEQEIKKN
jgi:ribonuclease P protein component